MTTIEFECEDESYSIKAIGHATGSEKVCSGVSAIMYALAGWLANNEVSASYVKLNSGDAAIGFTSRLESAQAAYDMAVIGLMQIAKAYPDFCEIKKN